MEKADIPTFELGEWLHDAPSFTDMELIDYLRKAYNQFAQGKLSFNMFREYRDTTDQYCPDAPLMQRRFGSWNKALEAAGIPTTPYTAGSLHFSDDELLNFLRTAYTELNQGQLTIAMYQVRRPTR